MMRSLKWEFEHGFRHNAMTAGAAMLGGGMLLRTVGGVTDSIAARRSANFNASMMDYQAQASIAEAKYKAGILRDRLRRVLGTQRAQYSASGVTMEGTPEFVQRDTIIQNYMDQIAIERSGEAQAAGYRAQAVITRQQGNQAFWRGLFDTGGDILSSAGSVDWGAT